MATHAGALGVAALAYWFARARAHAKHFTFGTGKVNALAGYTNAIVLALVALLMMIEAGKRLLDPVSVNFAEALPVAVLGLLVNLASEPRPVAEYREAILAVARVEHLTVEVGCLPHHEAA
jgi:Co/Zn/Cd efflux system component